MTSGIFDLAIIIAAAAALGILARLLKQPVILAYIATGLLIGIFGYFHLINQDFFRVFSDLGIMFLLFLIGLEINYTSLRLVGKISLILGLAQIVFTFIVGFGIALAFNFGYLEAGYLSIALTFSSTIIVVKLLSEKKDLNSLYGKITVGFLLVQDFVAILLLVVLAGIETGKNLDIGGIVFTVFKGIVLFGLMLWLGRNILPRVFDKIAKSQELLFLTSLAWCLGVATIVMKSGFSIEIGGFLAGIALANSSENFEIAAKIKSLRDFFILIFFVILGSSLLSSEFSGLTLPIIIFTLLVLIGNPLIVLIIMGFLGYKKRTSFLCGITTAQISEFSFILAALGLKLGHLNNEIVSLITTVGIITITVSSYLIIYNEEVFRYLSQFLSVFERKKKQDEIWEATGLEKPIVLIGAHRLGGNIIANLPKEDVLVVDFDPDIVSQLKREGYSSIFGDIADLEIQERANIKNAKLVISTSPDFEDNVRLVTEINSGPVRGKMPAASATSEMEVSRGAGESRPKIILRAENEEDAKLLYEKGADYVLLPYLTFGQYLGRSIAVDPELKILEQLKKHDLELMEKIKTRP